MKRLDVMEIIKEAIHLFTQQWQGWAVVTLVYFAIVFLGMMLLILPGLILAPPLTAGLFVVAFTQLRGGRVDLQDLWKGFDHFGASLVSHLLMWLLVLLGLCLCIIPGIVLAIWFMFATPALVATRCGGYDALGISRTKVAANFWDVCLFLLGLLVVQMICGMIPIVGSFIGIAIQTIMIAIAYRELFGLEGAVPTRIPAPAGAAPVSAQAKFCPQCGSANPIAGRFCVSCGKPLP